MNGYADANDSKPLYASETAARSDGCDLSVDWNRDLARRGILLGGDTRSRARIGLQAFIGTAMRQEEFHVAVVEPLLDSHSCPDRDCAECATRKPRYLADAFTILAGGTGQTGGASVFRLAA
ncbi:MAG TPA: hypothetical protein VJP76_09335 [Candidatus Tumulicola sp.]|nr:hypothetical protein [Candidatus Tumulicola sp.]